MTEREKRRAALRALVSQGDFRTLGEIRLQLAALKGFYVKEPQLWKDLQAINAERYVRWVLKDHQPEGTRTT